MPVLQTRRVEAPGRVAVCVPSEDVERGPRCRVGLGKA